MRIYLTGEITEDMYTELCTALDKSKGSVIIEVNSGGGGLVDARAIYSRIKHHPYPTTTIARGFVGSCALLPLIAGKRRLMCREAWLLHHEAKDVIKGRVGQIQHEVGHLQAVEDQFNRILAEHSNLPAEDWDTLASVETYLSAAEALKYGLVDEII